MQVLDLFSAACGGWSLGMHRAGFRTMAACEAVAWRRALYQENNPNVRIYDDVRTLTADRILRDCGFLPDIVVGSPPCQDISSANTKGKGVEGERSGLFFEAVRIIGEVRPRWFALENSANLRTRGADAVLAALEALGYACWAFVVGAGHVGANHERARSWLIGFDPEQISYPDGVGWDEGWERRRSGVNLSVPNAPIDPESVGHESRRPRGYGADGNSSPSIEQGHICKHGIRWPWACWECESETPYPPEERCHARAGFSRSEERHESEHVFDGPDAHQARRTAGNETSRAQLLGSAAGEALERTSSDGLGPDAIEERLQGIAWRDEQGQREVAQHPDLSPGSEMGGGSGPGCDFAEPWADWNGGPSKYLWMDARLRAWAFLAILLEEGGFRWAGDKLIQAVKSASSVERPSIEGDTVIALRTVLGFCSESTVRRLAPIAETLLGDYNIMLEPENTSGPVVRSVAEQEGSQSITLTKTGRTTAKRTSKRSALHVTPATTCEPDWKGVLRRAERRLKLFDRRQVEAFGDAVIPQIPEAIGRAMIRTEAALRAVLGRAA